MEREQIHELVRRSPFPLFGNFLCRPFGVSGTDTQDVGLPYLWVSKSLQIKITKILSKSILKSPFTCLLNAKIKDLRRLT